MRIKYPEIGKRIAKARKSMNLKQSDCLAPLGDITIQMLSSWENGHSFPSATYLIKISKFFNVSLDYLILGIDNQNEYKPISTYKEVLMHLEALKYSGLFRFSAINSSCKTISFSTDDSIITDFFLKLHKLEDALELLGNDIFNIKVYELLKSYDYELPNNKR